MQNVSFLDSSYYKKRGCDTNMKYIMVLISSVAIFGGCVRKQVARACEEKIKMKPALDNESLKKFWTQEAEHLSWVKKWDNPLIWNEPYAQWFAGGQLNASYNCLDVHVQGHLKNKIALHWEDELGHQQDLTYQQLYLMTNKYASVLQNLGVRKNDIVILYLPMIPQAIAMMLACARIGAIHSVVFSGFSSHSLRDRIADTQAQFVITADAGVRRGNKIALKNIVDEAVADSPSVKHVLVIKRFKKDIHMLAGRDLFLHEEILKAQEFVEPVPVESTHPLFILYTSGTTGKPKGLMHSTGGYLTYVRSTFISAFAPDENSVYWCTADIGWITGHSYVVYAPLLTGTTIIIQEGTPDYPDPGKWWGIIQKYKVSIFYTSPTALRMAEKYGDEWPNTYDLSSLKILGTVGEPINPEVWEWYSRVIGKNRCPVIDTWWQTETGGFMISPTAHVSKDALKPGSATFPIAGIDADVVDEHGDSVPAQTKGYLVIKKPWPGMSIGIYGDRDRFKDVYWSKFPGMYYPADYAIKDSDGFFWLLGRADEVLNIAGHRVGTAEIESAAITVPEVAEAAAIAVKDEIKGEGVIIFAILKTGVEPTDELWQRVIVRVREEIGKFVTPKGVYFVEKLPKTRSGKIMRRVLKAIIENKPVGDVSTLEDAGAVEQIKKVYERMKPSAYSGL